MYIEYDRRPLHLFYFYFYYYYSLKAFILDNNLRKSGDKKFLKGDKLLPTTCITKMSHLQKIKRYTPLAEHEKSKKIIRKSNVM